MDLRNFLDKSREMMAYRAPDSYELAGREFRLSLTGNPDDKQGGGENKLKFAKNEVAVNGKAFPCNVVKAADGIFIVTYKDDNTDASPAYRVIVFDAETENGAAYATRIVVGQDGIGSTTYGGVCGDDRTKAPDAMPDAFVGNTVSFTFGSAVTVNVTYGANEKTEPGVWSASATLEAEIIPGEPYKTSDAKYSAFCLREGVFFSELSFTTPVSEEIMHLVTDFTHCLFAGVLVARVNGEPMYEIVGGYNKIIDYKE